MARSGGGHPLATYLQLSSIKASTAACGEGTDTGWASKGLLGWEVRGGVVPASLQATSLAAPVLTTGSAVLYWDGSLLVALGLAALAVVAVGAAVAGADGTVGTVTSDAVAGAARGAAAVQADGVELALVLAFVWEERGQNCSRPPWGQGEGGGSLPRARHEAAGRAGA